MRCPAPGLTQTSELLMSHTARRFALAIAAVLATTLAACTNPVAPVSPSGVSAPAERSSADAAVYQGGVG